MAAEQGSNLHVENNVPPGYRFMPTDEELLDYLNQKILNKRIFTNDIKDVDLYKYHPSDLCQSKKNGTREGYFFTSRTRKYNKGGRPDRRAADGYWKATGGDIIVESNGQEVGRKKVLVYYEGKSENNNKGTKTNWIMHEFTIHQMKDVACSSTNAISDDKMLDKCLCRIYYRTSKSSKNIQQDKQRNVIPIQETHVPDANLAATSSYHCRNPVPEIDQSSLHGVYLPDPQASINDQYQFDTYMHGDMAPQPLVHIPGDQCNATLNNPLIPPETGMQSSDQYQLNTDMNDEYLDLTTPYFSPLFGVLSPLDPNMMDYLLGESSNGQLQSSPIPPDQPITCIHGDVGGSGTSNFAASTDYIDLSSPSIEWVE